MFRCATRYDWYLLQNHEYIYNTIIKSEDGKINIINLKEWKFIPNMMFDEIKNLISNNEIKLNLIHSESNYEVRRKWMSHTKTTTHIHPCIYSINKENISSFKWSEITSKGHFNICKFIFTNGAGFYCDIDGKYGLTQWASGIDDTIENLPLIEKAFRSKKFNKIKDAIQLDSSSYNIKVLKLFKKNFYDNFLNDEIDENINNEQKIIKDGRKQYYLIKDKLYKVKKDKSQGDLFGTYIDGKIEEIKIDKKPIKKPSKENNDELVDEPIIEVKRKK